MNNKLVLIVDDSGENSQYLRNLLLKHEYVATTANNGSEAVYMHSLHNFSLAIVNIATDGFEAIKLLRNTSQIPIIAMAPRAFKGDFETADYAGATDHLGKPVEESELMAIISKYLDQPEKN